MTSGAGRESRSSHSRGPNNYINMILSVLEVYLILSLSQVLELYQEYKTIILVVVIVAAATVELPHVADILRIMCGACPMGPRRKTSPFKGHPDELCITDLGSDVKP